MSRDRGVMRTPPSPVTSLDKSGGGGNSGDMEARVAKVEAGVEHLIREMQVVRTELRDIRLEHRTDFRLTWAGILALAAMMAKGFHWI